MSGTKQYARAFPAGAAEVKQPCSFSSASVAPDGQVRICVRTHFRGMSRARLLLEAADPTAKPAVALELADVDYYSARAFSPSGKYLAFSASGIGSNPKRLVVLDSETGKRRTEIP